MNLLREPRPVWPPSVASIIAATVLFLALAAGSGCASLKSGGTVTTNRVQAVAAVAAYFGAKTAIADGHRAEVQRAVDGLAALAASPTADPAAVIAALQASQITLPAGEEGQFLISTGVILFADFWAKTGQTALDNEMVRAFAAGLVRGARIALTISPAEQAARAAPRDDQAANWLTIEARKTRPTQ